MSPLPLTLLRRRPKTRAEETAEHDRRPTPHERARGVHVSEATRGLYQVASILLAYPTQELIDQLPTLRAAAEEARSGGARSAGRLLPMIDRLGSTDLGARQSEYVETFDLRRRCCLFLTYYGYGDTRRRGMALLDLKQSYQASGVRLSDDELPDHLCVLLEFAATVDPAVGRVLLLDHRPGLELLRIALADRQSPYLSVLEAITGTFPALGGEGKDLVARLIAHGPPDEEVGIETLTNTPYLPAADLTDLADRTDPTDRDAPRTGATR